jgi:rubredoxin
VSRLRCESCGLAYSRAAIARQMVLATGVACRRCGGTLEAEDGTEDPEPMPGWTSVPHGPRSPE